MKDDEKAEVMRVITRLEALQEIIVGYPSKTEGEEPAYLPGDSGESPEWFDNYIESTKNILEDLLA